MGSASAEPPPTTAAPAPTYAMPSVTDMSLSKAEEVIAAIASDVQFPVSVSISGGSPAHVVSAGSWVVCGQAPQPGRRLTSKSKIVVEVNRPWNGC
jgi:hypothetical protein